MPVAQPLLEDSTANESVRLRREIAGLEQELQEAKVVATAAKQAAADAIEAISALRRQLEPLYKSLRMIFGEISRVDAEVITGAKSSDRTSGTLTPKWEMLQSRLGGRQAEFIDLLQHGEMSVAQLRAAAHCDIRTAYKTIEKMKAGGLLNKNGGKFSLKQL
jgi:hypothetical protein